MKPHALFALLLLAACSSGPATFSKPAAHAQAWDLNPGRWPGTNDLIHEPVGSR
jgi:hypothetical protein